MTSYNSHTKRAAVLLALIMLLSMMTGCFGKDKETETNPDGKTTTSANADSDVSKDATAELESGDADSDEADGKNSSTTEKSDKTTKKASASTTKKQTSVPTTVAPPKTPAQSGLNNKPSQVENATDSSDLANVNPNEAANNSYDTEVSIEQTNTNVIDVTDFPYIPYSDFESHIHSVWAKFQVNDKVKIEAKYMNEYLNYICLPLKESFSEINCNGYDVTYGYDTTGTYAYLDVNWAYYITSAQYTTCKTKASEICNGLSGSTADKIKAVHDRIAKDNSYVLNVDGAYNCLVNHKSDCDGYTAAFKICMDILGIPCKAYATSDHIFNLVQVDGKWYVVDVTYDDQTPSGFIYTRYFLTGSSMYTNYPILTSMLSSADYPYSKKITVTDDTKFRTFLKLDDSVTYTLDDDGHVNLSNGYYYVIK